MQTVFADEAQNIAHFKRVQLDKFTYAYSLRALVQNSAAASPPITRALLSIESDAGFMVEEMSGSAKGPIDSVGARILAGLSSNMAPGCTAGYAERGLQIKVTDLSQNQEIMRGYILSGVMPTPITDFIPIETLFTPGYGFSPFYRPVKFTRYWPANSQILFEIRNTDTAEPETNFHSLDLCLLGKRMDV
jgi:hypothetical protein